MQKKLTPLKAIQKKCLDCCCGQITEVRKCPVTDCALHEYRKGHLPDETPMYDARESKMTEEQKEAARERLRIARENKKKR